MISCFDIAVSTAMNKKLTYIVFTVFIALLALLQGCGGNDSPGQPAQPDVRPPVAAMNSGMTAGDGRINTLRASELSYIDDTQPRASITYTVFSQPQHGQLESIGAPGEIATQFTQDDIDSGRIIYKHKRGNSLSGDFLAGVRASQPVFATADSFLFDVSDGRGNTLFGESFSISIVPNVTNMSLTLDGGLVAMQWQVPLQGSVSKVRVVRKDDGQYPKTPFDGVLVGEYPSGVSEATDPVNAGITGEHESFYYTVFSLNDDDDWSGGVNVGVYCDPSNCVIVPELRDISSIDTEEDANNLRTSLINGLWGTSDLPDGQPVSVLAISDARYSAAASIHEVIASLDYGLTSTMWYFSPLAPNGQLIVFHQGHGGAFHRSSDRIQDFLQNGFHVLGVSMPLYGTNFDANAVYASHDELFVLDRPMRLFLEPVAVGINYATATDIFSKIYMMGISGGGWTTIVYSAIDERIDASYPIAGSYPFYLRPQVGGGSLGDSEQYDPDFYSLVSYLDLYLLAAQGRRHLQVYNVFDSCCFGGTFANTFRYFVANRAVQLGGTFDAIVDDSEIGHVMSDYAITSILADINSN